MMLDQLGIEKITIDLPFRLDHVNCFLAKGENGYVMIDTGLHDERAKRTWKKHIENKEIDQMILTHLHPDHSGYAGHLQQVTNARVRMTEVDSKALQKMWKEESLETLKIDYERAAVPERLMENLLKLNQDFRPAITPLPKIDDFLIEGEMIQIGKERYEVIFTPGHSAGLVCFYNKEKNVLLSTDHILPKITPNISYWFYGEMNPLHSFEQSLNKIKKLEVEYVIPSHGEPFYDANKRIEEIWSHHLERFDIVMDALADRGAPTIFTVCEKLFEKELSLHDYQFAIGETIAHLEYLRYKGECKRELRGKEWVYSI